MGNIKKTLILAALLGVSPMSWAGAKGGDQGRQREQQKPVQQEEQRQERQERQEVIRQEQQMKRDLLLAQLSLRAAKRPNMEVCEIEVETFALNNFVDTDLIISYLWDYSGEGSPASYAGIRRPECSLDEYILPIHGTFDTCHNAHYGRLPSYVLRGYATGRCN